jgi:hypothetical protein
MKAEVGSIAAYRIVRVSSTTTGNFIALCSATSDVPFGVTQDNCNAVNQYVPVAIGGIARVYVNDSLAAGAAFCTDAVGRAVPYTTPSTGGYMVGINIGPKVNATGAIAEVLIRPLFTAAPA